MSYPKADGVLLRCLKCGEVNIILVGDWELRHPRSCVVCGHILKWEPYQDAQNNVYKRIPPFQNPRTGLYTRRPYLDS